MPAQMGGRRTLCTANRVLEPLRNRASRPNSSSEIRCDLAAKEFWASVTVDGERAGQEHKRRWQPH